MAFEAAVQLSKRAKQRSLQLRKQFLRQTTETDDALAVVPPLVRFLRGGRAGGPDAVRLKLYLSLLWFCSGEKGGVRRLPAHSAQMPAAFFAKLLDLEEPDQKGKRRVLDAFRWLERERFVELGLDPGRSPVVTILREDGSGAPYTIPGKKYEGQKDMYLKLAKDFLQNGWLALLSGPSIAVLLALMDRPDTDGKPIWLSGSVKAQYHISPDTWHKGKEELARFEVVKVKRAPVRQRLWDNPQMRDTFDLRLKRFEQLAPIITRESQ